MKSDDYVAAEALARAGADFAITVTRDTLAAFDRGELNLGEALAGIAAAGAEADRVVLARQWRFLLEESAA